MSVTSEKTVTTVNASSTTVDTNATATNVSAATYNELNTSNFDLLSVLGFGGFGKVFQVRKKCEPRDGEIFAMKVIRKEKAARKPSSIEHAKAEKNVLSILKHPFIVEMAFAFQTKEKLYLVLTYAAGGDLTNLLETQYFLRDPEARFYASEIILAIGYLHSQGVIYRDLKPSNIMLDSAGHIRLVDFGLCKEGIFHGDRAKSFCGTIRFMAPEMLLKQPYGHSVDWWSFGAVLYDMLNGEPPFDGCTAPETIHQILHSAPNLKYVEAELADLLKKLMCKDPEKRLGSGETDAEEIKQHVWFKDTDWSLVYERGLTPPIVPKVRGPEDVSNFDRYYTKAPAVLTPERKSLTPQRYQELFSDFTFIRSQSPKSSSKTKADKEYNRSPPESPLKLSGSPVQR